MTDSQAYLGQNPPQDDTQLPVEPQLPPAPPVEEFPSAVDPQTQAFPQPQTETVPPESAPTQPLEPSSQAPQAQVPPPSTDTAEDTADSDQDKQEDFSQSFYDNQPQPEEVVLEWQAPSRPFKKRNRQYYTTVGIIVFLICMILFLAGQFLPIAVVIAVAFMAYVLSAVPPEMVINRVTTYGIRTDDTLYYWEELGRFWFSEKYHQKLVHIEVARFPNVLTLVLGDQDGNELAEALSLVLLNEKPPLGAFDKAAQWLQEKIPLDTEA
ncbi:hypothetical protein H3C70_04415 [Patescibacteria group bacterium]|nr:hypothetical protein [Patescibacteria group bacterium]